MVGGSMALFEYTTILVRSLSMVKLRWKKAPKSSAMRGLEAGYIYHDGTKKYASVSPLYGQNQYAMLGWYWVAGWDSDIPHKNTCNDVPYKTADLAKKAAAEYVKSNLISQS